METASYVAQLRTALLATAEAGGAEARRSAELLTTAVEPALRLVLLDVLADAADELGAQVGTPVSVRLGPRGAVELVADHVTEPVAVPVDDGGELARLTLRIPQPLKDTAESVAAASRTSLNAFLTAAVQRAVDHALVSPSRAGTTRSTGRVSGWVRS